MPMNHDDAMRTYLNVHIFGDALRKRGLREEAIRMALDAARHDNGKGLRTSPHYQGFTQGQFGTSLPRVSSTLRQFIAEDLLDIQKGRVPRGRSLEFVSSFEDYCDEEVFYVTMDSVRDEHVGNYLASLMPPGMTLHHDVWRLHDTSPLALLHDNVGRITRRGYHARIRSKYWAMEAFSND